MAKTRKEPKRPRLPCGCFLPIRHYDCAYCGIQCPRPDYICGVCKEDGVDGKVIRGTERHHCGIHLTKEPAPVNTTNRFMKCTWCDYPGGTFSEDQCSDLGKQVMDLIHQMTGGYGNHRRANKASLAFTFYQYSSLQTSYSFKHYDRETVLVLGDRLKELVGTEKVKVKVTKNKESTYKTPISHPLYYRYRRPKRESVVITLY